MSTSPDWTRFTLKIFIDKPVKDLYNAWTIPTKLTTWFLETADYTDKNGNPKDPAQNISEGDRYTWKWNNHDIIEKGTVLSANEKDKVGFTFGAAGNVEVNLRETARGTEVTLVQDNIPVDENSKKDYYVGCNQGWTFWLTNLKAWQENGILLNAKGYGKEEMKYLINA